MCFGPEAVPPSPPVTGNLAASDRLTIRAADGAESAARLARTARQGAPGVVLLPDVRGLHGYYEQLADSFAGAGLHALTFDFYARTAGTAYRSADFDFAPHRQQVRDATLNQDVDAAVTALRDVDPQMPVYVLGFCFGGRGALMQGVRDDVAGVVGFYPWPTRREEGGSSPADEARAGRVRSRVLALYGGADAKIDEAARGEYEEALRAGAVEHEAVTYEGAPHGFFDRHQSAHADACDDAWRRVLDFTGVLSA